MKRYLSIDPWNIVEEGFDPRHHRLSESIFSIGNGKMGMRGNFEEQYSGPSLQGNYLAGIYYPDKTRVGWWKNGYPEYFAKVLNAVHWVGLEVMVDGQPIDLYKNDISRYKAVLDMKKGLLQREFVVKLGEGKDLKICTERFYSMADDEIGAMKYEITPLNFDAKVELISLLDFDVVNNDANYDERFWTEHDSSFDAHIDAVKAVTHKTRFEVWCHGHTSLQTGGQPVTSQDVAATSTCIHRQYSLGLTRGQSVCLTKVVSIVSSFYYARDLLGSTGRKVLEEAVHLGYETLLDRHVQAWAQKWEEHDIRIEGDASAQQAIRYNIFMLNQTYTGKDARLNIGPKGFTGEKYGGSTYWDTEAYCLPFYLSTTGATVAKNLLLYRYHHLPKAIENAEKLGFTRGAALYPMVTMNGEECHNEWEITFEEIHRNGAIAFAIYYYTRYTGDETYLISHGLEVLIGIARFWAQRFSFSKKKGQFVLLGVTGPNEYENNVNNNWYTNYISRWCLSYTVQMLEKYREHEHFEALIARSGFDFQETNYWKEIIDRVYLPYDEKKGIFLQQEGFLDKELIPVSELPESELPLVQHWSWDRILRSCFIKQADVLQGLYFFEEDFDKETIERNFDFYEPMTVHESSLSPCVHSILACRLQRIDKAYQLFLRTSRLDLDNINHDTEDGCHITSMAGTWMSVVIGFGGMKIKDNALFLSPVLPHQWRGLSFRIQFRNHLLEINITPDRCSIHLQSDKPLDILLYGKKATLQPGVNSFSFSTTKP